MKYRMNRIIAAILSVLLLVSLAACKKTTGRTDTPATDAPSTEQAGSTLPVSTGSPGVSQNSQVPENGSDSTPDPEETPGTDSSSTIGTPSSVTPTVPADAERVIVELDSVEVLKGTILDPVVTILSAEAEDIDYTLSTSDDSVLRQVYGFWTAVGGGSAELTATSANGVTGSVIITVTVPLEAVTLSASAISLNRGDSVTLTPVFTPDDTTETLVYYTTDDETIASVTENGTVFAAGAGTTTITCTAGEYNDTCTVTVIVPMAGISMSTDRRIYKVGDRGSFTVQISPQDATDQTFSTEISSAAATLTGTNTFSCDAGGEVTITVTAANGMTASQTITVIDLVSYANEVFRLTNIERINAGLEPFTSSSPLTRTAVVRAGEIISQFSHDRPDGSDCFTAFDDNYVTYNRAGENIAMGQRSAAEVVRGWMESPGHRENILNSEFGRLGVGVAMDSSGRLYWAQSFAD